MAQLFTKKLLNLFISSLMKNGKKEKAEVILFKSLMQVKILSKQNPYQVVIAAVKNVRPAVVVRPYRLAGATYMIPVPLDGLKQIKCSVKWIVEAARLRNETDMSKRLAAELVQASRGIGGAMGKKKSTHQLAHQNQAFAHFRW